MSRISITQEADPLRKSLGDPEKDVDGLEDSEKDMGDLEDKTNHSQVSLKEGKTCQMSCRNQKAEKSERDEWYSRVQYLTQEPRDLGQHRGHVAKGRMVRGFQAHQLQRRIYAISRKRPNQEESTSRPYDLDVSF